MAAFHRSARRICLGAAPPGKATLATAQPPNDQHGRGSVQSLGFSSVPWLVSARPLIYIRTLACLCDSHKRPVNGLRRLAMSPSFLALQNSFSSDHPTPDRNGPEARQQPAARCPQCRSTFNPEARTDGRRTTCSAPAGIQRRVAAGLHGRGVSRRHALKMYCTVWLQPELLPDRPNLPGRRAFHLLLSDR
jgi:hypothetical protein